MAINKRLLVKPPSSGVTPSEHFGVVLYKGDGSSSRSINGGKFGAGAYFNNQSFASWIFASNLDGNVLPTDKPWGASFWLNTSALSGGNTTAIAHMKSSSPYSGWAILMGATTIEVAINGSTPAPATGSKPPRDNNNWHHFVLSYDGSGTTTLYYDGSFKATYSGTIGASDSHLKLGTANVWGGYTGKIDQVRMFSKAISSSQAATLYAETVDTVESLDPLNVDTTDTLQVLGDTSCIATYRFENNEDDLSGNYDLTGNAIQYAAGRYGQAASFNGSSSYAEITSSPPQDSSGVMSVSFWTKTSSTSRAAFFIVEGPSTAREFLKLENYGYQGTNSFRISYNNAFLGNIDNEAISDGNWHHIVITAGNGNVKTYKDNSLLATQSVTITDQTIDNFVIGYRKYNNDLYFNGEIDQFRIFNKELSAAEVTTLYNENPLVASYRLDGNANDDTRNYDGTATSVTYEYGLDFTPDLVWIKSRSFGRNHYWYDTTRGANKQILSNATDAEANITGRLSAFNTGGFTVGSSSEVNNSGETYAAWAFKANGGTTSSNSDGSITSTVQTNTSAGFSIVKYTGNGTDNATVGHGLSQTPELYILKNLDDAHKWPVHTQDVGSLSGNQTGALNLTEAFSSYGKNATSTVLTFSTGADRNPNGDDMIAYCFHSVEGFSKFGTYTGTGATQSIETGFEVEFLLIKGSSFTTDWMIYDKKRSGNNYLIANSNAAEGGPTANPLVTFLSNGFQVHTSNSENKNNETFIYMAFAADPDTEAPTVAKSFTVKTYTGNGGTQSITGTGFKPNLVWIKHRNEANDHVLTDSIRGLDGILYSNGNDAQASGGQITSFDTDGFSLKYSGGQNVKFNKSGGNYVAWAWKADDNEPTAFFNSVVTGVYKFEDNVNDVAGVNNGANGVDIAYTSSGKFNKAVISNGTNTEVSLSQTPPMTTAWTFSFWFYATESGSAIRVILQTGTGFAIGLELSKIFIFTGGSNRGSGTSISLNTWYHYAATYDGTSVKTYLNGSLAETITTLTGMSAGNLKLFDPPYGSWAHYTGRLDQLRVYSTGLSSTQITALYNETTSDNDTVEFPTGLPNGSVASIVSANANAGFSIVKYTGSGGNMKVPHGLSAAPDMLIVKGLETTNDWAVLHKDGSNGDFLQLNGSSGESGAGSIFGSTFTRPNATVFTVGNTGETGTANKEYIAYCFHSVSGYSKFGGYTGNGSSKTITTGFQPDWLMFKRIDQNGWYWEISDTVRGIGVDLAANKSNAEQNQSPGNRITINTDGFTHTTANYHNISGASYIYMAFKIN